MYIYRNEGNLAIPELPGRNLSDGEFTDTVTAYAAKFDGEPVVMESTLIASGYYEYVHDNADADERIEE